MQELLSNIFEKPLPWALQNTSVNLMILLNNYIDTLVLTDRLLAEDVVVLKISVDAPPTQPPPTHRQMDWYWTDGFSP